jgi:hypothetical protein
VTGRRLATPVRALPAARAADGPELVGSPSPKSMVPLARELRAAAAGLTDAEARCLLHMAANALDHALRDIDDVAAVLAAEGAPAARQRAQRAAQAVRTAHLPIRGD